MKRKFLSLAVVLLTATLLFASCASKMEAEDSAYNYYAGGDVEYTTDEMVPESSISYSLSDNKGSPTEDAETEAPADRGEESARKIIMRYHFSVETKDLDASVAMLEAAVANCGGYYETSEVSGNTENGGWGEFVLRIPSGKTDEFNTGISDFGNITSQSKNGEDVTTQYYDTENRLKSLKIQQERLLALLEKAESLEDILKIETELTNVRTEIESLTTVLLKYDNLIDYTTVTINLRQVKVYTEPVPETFGTKIAETFKDSIEFTKEVFEGITLAVIWLAPLLVFLGIVAVVVIVIVTKSKKKRAGKNKKANTEKTEE